MMKLLQDQKLLLTSTGFPNADYTSIKGIFIKNQLTGVQESFSEVSIIVPVLRRGGLFDRDSSKMSYSYSNVNVIYSKPFFFSYGGLKTIAIDKWEKSLKRSIIRHKIEFDLIHAHFGGMGCSSVPISQEFNNPLITSFYGYDAYVYKYDSEYYKSLFNAASLILTLSDHMNNQYLGRIVF